MSITPFSADEKVTRANVNNRLTQIDNTIVSEVAKAKWTLLQSYTIAGSYTFTVPSGVSEIGVEIIGGGGGGALIVLYDSSTMYCGAGGGASGQVIQQIFNTLTSGTQVPVVVGAAGAGGSYTYPSEWYNDTTVTGGAGGSSSFNGIAAVGGEGGKGSYGSNTYSGTVGSTGGQSTAGVCIYYAIQQKDTFPKSPAGATFYLPLAGVENYNYGARSTPKPNLSLPQDMVSIFRENPLDLIIGAGASAFQQNDNTTNTLAQANATLPNGSVTGASLATRKYNTSFSVAHATGFGNGGGGLVSANSSSNSSWAGNTYSAGNGAPGAVFVYGR